VIAPTVPARKDQTRPPPTPMLPSATPSAPMPVLARTMTPAGVPIVPLPGAPLATPTDGVALQRPSWPPGLVNVSVPSHEGLPFSEEQAQQMRRQFFRIGGAVLGILFLIAIIKSCAGGGSDGRMPPPDPAPAKAPEPSVPSVTPPPAQPDARVVEPEPAIPDAGVTATATDPTPVTPNTGSAASTDAGSAAGSGSATKPKDKRKKPPRTNPTQPYNSPIAPPRPSRKK
jgi:hypothetical protein